MKMGLNGSLGGGPTVRQLEELIAVRSDPQAREPLPEGPNITHTLLLFRPKAHEEVGETARGTGTCCALVLTCMWDSIAKTIAEQAGFSTGSVSIGLKALWQAVGHG